MLSLIEVDGFAADGHRVVAKRPVTFSPELDDTKQYYVLDDAPFGIQLLAGSRDELEAALYDELDFLWRQYAEERNEVLTDDALELKRQLLDTFEVSL